MKRPIAGGKKLVSLSLTNDNDNNTLKSNIPALYSTAPLPTIDYNIKNRIIDVNSSDALEETSTGLLPLKPILKRPMKLSKLDDSVNLNDSFDSNKNLNEDDKSANNKSDNDNDNDSNEKHVRSSNDEIKNMSTDNINTNISDEMYDNVDINTTNDQLDDLKQLKDKFSFNTTTIDKLKTLNKEKIIKDDLFYKSSQLSINSLISTIEDPLHIAIANNNLIDIQIILNELSDDILYHFNKLDHLGRSIFHVTTISKSTEVLTLIMNTYREILSNQLNNDLKSLDNELEYCKIAFDNNIKKLSNKQLNMQKIFQLYNKTINISNNKQIITKFQIIENWFIEEKIRLKRLLEFKIKSWWIFGMSCRDEDGRSPLHYAISLNVSSSFIDILLSYGLTNQLDNQLFNKISIYNTITGQILGTINGNNRIDSLLSDSKVENVSIIPSSINNQINTENYTINYEIIIPWLIRNIYKQCISRGKRSNRTGHDILLKLINTIDDEKSGVLIFSEIKRLLDQLDIKVSSDVIKELCSRYTGAIDKCIDKYIRKKNLFEQQQKLKLLADYKYSNRLDSKEGNKIERKVDSKIVSNSKIDSKSYNEVESKIDSETSLSDSKVYNRSKYKDNKESKDIIYDNDPPTYKESNDYNDTFNDEDKELGLDIYLFLNDIKTGKGFQSIDMTGSMNRSTSTIKSFSYNKLSNENVDSKNDTTNDCSLDSTINSKIDKKLDNHIIDVSYKPIVLPNQISISTISKYHRRIVNQCDLYNRSPLILASMLGYDELVSILCKYHCDISITTVTGDNAISVANNHNTKKILNEYLYHWLNNNKVDNKKNTSESTIDSTTIISNNQIDSKMIFFNSLIENIKLLPIKISNYSSNPLIYAIRKGYIDVVKQLLVEGVNVNESDVLGRTSLHECSSTVRDTSNISTIINMIIISELILIHSYNINISTLYDKTVLHEMVSCSSNGYITNQLTNYETNDSNNQIKYYKSLYLRNLLHWNINPFQRDRYDYSTIQYCCKYNYSNYLLEILTHNKLKYHIVCNHLNSQLQNILHISCSNGSIDCVKIIIKWNMDNILDNKFNLLVYKDVNNKLPKHCLQSTYDTICLTSLWQAAFDGDSQMVMKILSSIKLNDYEDISLNTISNTTYANSNQSTHINQSYWLIDTIDAQTFRMKWSTLHCCVVGLAKFVISSNKSVQLLLKKYIPYDKLKNKKKYNKAKESSNYYSLLETLLKRGIYVDMIDCNGRTALMIASTLNIPQACTILISHGANVNYQDLDGNTALHLAYIYGNTQIIGLLESKGADNNIENYFNQYPIDIIGNDHKIQPLFESKL